MSQVNSLYSKPVQFGGWWNRADRDLEKRLKRLKQEDGTDVAEIRHEKAIERIDRTQADKIALLESLGRKEKELLAVTMLRWNTMIEEYKTGDHLPPNVIVTPLGIMDLLPRNKAISKSKLMKKFSESRQPSVLTALSLLHRSGLIAISNIKGFAMFGGDTNDAKVIALFSEGASCHISLTETAKELIATNGLASAHEAFMALLATVEGTEVLSVAEEDLPSSIQRSLMQARWYETNGPSWDPKAMERFRESLGG